MALDNPTREWMCVGVFIATLSSLSDTKAVRYSPGQLATRIHILYSQPAFCKRSCSK